MSEENASRIRTYVSYLLAVVFVVVVLGMLIVTGQAILYAT
jgi:hypothetical protein